MATAALIGLLVGSILCGLIIAGLVIWAQHWGGKFGPFGE